MLNSPVQRCSPFYKRCVLNLNVILTLNFIRYILVVFDTFDVVLSQALREPQAPLYNLQCSLGKETILYFIIPARVETHP